MGQDSSASGQSGNTLKGRVARAALLPGSLPKMGTSEPSRSQRREASLTHTASCCPLVAVSGMFRAPSPCSSAPSFIHPQSVPFRHGSQDPNPGLAGSLSSKSPRKAVSNPIPRCVTSSLLKDLGCWGVNPRGF